MALLKSKKHNLKLAKSRINLSKTEMAVFILAFGVVGAIIWRSFAAAPDSVVTINPSNVYYTLPKYWLGGKMVAYGASITEGTYQGGPAPKTNDGKDFDQLILESGLDSVSQSIYGQGTPSNPDSNWGAVSHLQYLMVLGGTINGVTYPGGAAASPHFMMSPNTTPTTTPPEDQPANRAPASSDASRENIKAWIDKYVKDLGIDHIMSVEFYNEPATLNNKQAPAGDGDWYSYNNSSSASRYAADFATNGHRVVDDYVRAAYPTLHTYGAAYAGGASNGDNGGEIERFVCGYPGWAWGSDCNTNHMYGISTHSYGTSITNGNPGAPGGQPQSIFNAIFYPEGSTPLNPGITSGKSGYVAYQNRIRAILDEHGGQNTHQFMSEWWSYDGADLSGPEGSRSAMADVLGVIANTQNGATWKQSGMIIQCVNASPYNPSTNKFDLPDCIFGVSGGRLYRSPRYYAIKDLEAPFAAHEGNKRLVSTNVSSPSSPGGVAGNSVKSIQASVAINSSGTDMKILVANLDMVNSHTTQFRLGATGTGPITGKYLPASQPIDTDLPSLPAISYDDGSKTSFTYTLGAGTAALFDIPIGNTTTNPQPPANTAAPAVSGAAQVGSTLAASQGSWTNSPTSYAYQWQRCTSTAASSCSDISSATVSTYKLASSDLNDYVRVEVTASNLTGQATTASSMTSAVTNSSTPPPTSLSIPATATPPTIDGQLSEAGWQLSTTANKSVVGSTNNQTSFGAMWDNNYLYLGVKVQDSSLNNAASDVWQNDAVEVYLDPTGAGGTSYTSQDRQFIVGWNNPSLYEQTGHTSGVKHAWATIPGGYSVELAIPWSNLGVTPTSGMSLGLDIANDDNDGGATRVSQSVWAGTADDWDNPSVFGKASLTGSPSSPPTNPPTVAGDLNGDGKVDIADLSILLAHFNDKGSGLTGDLNNDGRVDIADLSILLSNWGR